MHTLDQLRSGALAGTRRLAFWLRLLFSLRFFERSVGDSIFLSSMKCPREENLSPPIIDLIRNACVYSVL